MNLRRGLPLLLPQELPNEMTRYVSKLWTVNDPGFGIARLEAPHEENS